MKPLSLKKGFKVILLCYLYSVPILTHFKQCFCCNYNIYFHTGIAFGIIVKTYLDLSELDKLFISFPGEILTRLLQLVIVPVIVTSVMTGKLEVYFSLC